MERHSRASLGPSVSSSLLLFFAVLFFAVELRSAPSALASRLQGTPSFHDVFLETDGSNNVALTEEDRVKFAAEEEALIDQVFANTEPFDFDELSANETAATSGSRRSLRGKFRGCTVVVAKDGSGKYSSIQDAVDSLKGSFFSSRTSPAKVCIKAGTYKETVRVKQGQNYVTFVGAGKGTRIVGSNTQSKVGNPFYAATLIIEADYFEARQIRVENSVLSTTEPAPAVALFGTKSRWRAVAISGWVDTFGIYTGYHYVTGSYISGITDFVWGFGKVFVSESVIHARHFPGSTKGRYKGAITAMGTDGPSPSGGSGAVLFKCNVIGDSSATTYLGRPYRSKTLVAFAFCNLGSAVLAKGWTDWAGQWGSTAQFYEYGNRGPGASSSGRQFGKVGGGSSFPSSLSARGFLGYPW